AFPGCGPSWSETPEVAVDRGAFDVPRAIVRDANGIIRTLPTSDLDAATTRAALEALAALTARIEREAHNYSYELLYHLSALDVSVAV
ncbi:MAG: hypothetical protein M3N13_09940, partial [Candidatus Eremiobacteraeota bacterium]|nr:hypothetical protein [Candidatus Eremiobacteraeota bacterium]